MNSARIVDILLGEADDAMLRELGAVAAAPSIALQNWDHAINKSSDTTAAWRHVFHSLGYMGLKYNRMASILDEAEWELGYLGDAHEYWEEEKREWLEDILPKLKGLWLPPVHIDAIKAVWDRNKRQATEEGMLDYVARAGMESPEQVKAIQWLWFNRVNET